MKYEVLLAMTFLGAACGGDGEQEAWTDEALKTGADPGGAGEAFGSVDPGKDFGGADPSPDTVAIPYKCVESLGTSWCTCRADVEGDCTGMSTFCRNNGGDGIVTCEVFACSCSYTADPEPDPEPDPK
jgi:hypothetical protein